MLTSDLLRRCVHIDSERERGRGRERRRIREGEGKGGEKEYEDMKMGNNNYGGLTGLSFLLSFPQSLLP